MPAAIQLVSYLCKILLMKLNFRVIKKILTIKVNQQNVTKQNECSVIKQLRQFSRNAMKLITYFLDT